MNKKKRITMVRAMETVCRALNDEEGILDWLTVGVADGDITEETVDEELESYTDDETFADLMDSFAAVMSDYVKKKSISDHGHFFVDGVLSKPQFYS